MCSIRFQAALILLAAVLALAGCSSVSFLPLEGEAPRDSKPDGFAIHLLDIRDAQQLRIIGKVSCQDSARSSIWNWWTDSHALIEEMKAGNRERLIAKVKSVGGDALIDLKHEIITGGGGGGGIGIGAGVGHGGVGVGVGTSIFGSNPKLIVVSHGKVGVSAE